MTTRWPLSRLALRVVVLAWAAVLGWWLAGGAAAGRRADVCPWCGGGDRGAGD